MNKIDLFRGQFYFLSNFYPCKVMIQGIEYPSAEHAFQAGKTKDLKIRKDIASLETPGLAKKYGRKLVLRSDWELVKLLVMAYVVECKFNQNAILRDRLINTGDFILEEGNTWGDRVWGTVNGVGENHLGKILMKIRESLRGKDESIYS